MSAPSFAPILLSPHSLESTSHPRRSTRRVESKVQQFANISRVVACLDGSDLGRGVVPHARLVSNALKAQLTLLHVLEANGGEAKPLVPTDPLDWGIRQREAQAHLREAASRIGDVETEVQSELIQGRPAEQICHWTENHQIDLTVLCSHGSHGMTEWDLASTARKLIDRIPGSILLIPAVVAADAEVKEVRYSRILIPLDGSARAESVIPVAMRIAASQDAEVLFVHVVTVPEILRTGLPDAEGAELERRVLEYNHRIANEYLNRLRARVERSGARVKSLVVDGESARTGLDQVIRDEQPDIVVMSAHGSTGRLDSPCGSVAEYAFTHASVPLLVMRERSEGSARRVERSATRPIERGESVGPLIS